MSANPHMICPHCQTKGQVTTREVKVKTGLGGGKVVAGILTMGLSTITPGIGLSNKKKATEATCGKCKSVWQF